MAHQDPIADMLTRLRNAVTARRKFVDMPLSSLKHDVLKVLVQQGFIEHVLVDDEHKKMRVFLKYAGGRAPVLQGLRRISRPSLRRYITKHEIPKISGGLGLAIVSTSQGVVDGETARQKGIGGELLCYIW
ncbi:MAG TPA: 30S ribosomal protein S8 [Rhabdochlamydiaceae bacterium]|jgi:small subunit ribosomal protein S8|nr:30S ribosomal protein S8 [Rhabdochlamydiaceae bacterium]